MSAPGANIKPVTMEQRYYCANTKQCDKYGCPGHLIRLVHDTAADTVTIIQDGVYKIVFSRQRWMILMSLETGFRAQRARAIKANVPTQESMGACLMGVA